MSAPVALVTAAPARHLDADLDPLVAALAACGVPADVVVWDDPAVPWAAYRLVVVRSTWDYVARHAAFLAWAEAVAGVTELANPAPMIRWNTDKRYLRDLGQAGVPVVPTVFHEPGQPVHVPPIEVVVKPAVSAGAADTGRYPPARRDEAVAHVEALLAAGRVAMVQPYLGAVDDTGETALVFFDGVFSHAVRKGPILVPGVDMVEGLYAEEDITPRQPAPAELAVAEQALAAVPAALGLPLYARVDVVPGPDGDPVVLELELTEPSVFHAHGPGSADRFAAAIVRRLAP